MRKDYSSFPPIGIIAYSDSYSEPDPRVWGDYWLKENLLREFSALGYPVDNLRPKVLLHLFGEPLERVPDDVYSVLWIHSHPDWITPEILRRYRKIYCISDRFCRKLRTAGFDAGHLMVPTAMTPLRRDREYDVVFVGNTKQGMARKIVRDLGDVPCRVKVWGWGWKGLIPDEWYGGEYYENSLLGGLYAASGVVLNDHHEDMRREGFINPRILDVLASGGFVVSDSVAGLDELFDGSVPAYRDAEDLRRIITRYLRDDAARAALSERGRRIALLHTFRGVCEEIAGHIETVSDTVIT
ncbi:MAG: glycosyltransferase [Nitrospiraceae bacterium]|nr:glycosyltransferase [Nitrospiraceae bacterium]